jgi:AraC-like DNA-binding protein
MDHVNDMAIQGMAVGGSATSLPFDDGARSVAGSRRRVRIGAINLDIRRFTKLSVAPLAVRPNIGLLVVALEGTAEVVNETFRATVDDGRAVLLARPGSPTLVWSAGSEGVVMQWPRALMQVLASQSLGLPVRLAASDTVLPFPSGKGLPALVTELVDETGLAGSLPDHRERLWAARLEAATLRMLVEHPNRNSILPVARSILRAMQHVRDNAETNLDAVTLAGMSGITARTLREGFRACFGVPLASYIQEARLKRARERLASRHDFCSIAEIARAAGFGSASSFSRAYVRAFKETASQTRARSVGDAQVGEVDL